ncbi:DUF3987 domain-containing protein [Prevotella corporis]|uniref:DUF3987 domain-containing protein n=1 Tax=Prevotella corporis TaxID=28128 RepID=UPI000416E005|nr:DUF3987 domain-containing protein [Prevotella corporis]MDQ7737424.1 DUF3987 domain-containing protein [Prevotella corporis]
MAIIETVNGKYDTEKCELLHVEYSKEKKKETTVVENMNPAIKCEPTILKSGTNIVTQRYQINVRPDALMEKPDHLLPSDYLMPEVHTLADMMASTMKCSEDIVLSTIFAVVSGAVGSKVLIDDGVYHNRANINVCHIAPPGSNKTQPVSKLVKPLEKISSEKMLAYRDELERCKREKDNSETPHPQILFVTNPTPEAINKTLAFNTHGLFVRRDELSGFIDDLCGRYSNGGGGVPDFLSTFTNESISIIRSGEDPLVVSSPYLTVVGGMQPKVLTSVLGKSQLANSGFNYRWLFVAPEIQISTERSHEGMNQELLNWWEVLIRRFHNMAPMNLFFSTEAQKLLDDYYCEIALKKVRMEDDYMDETRNKLFIYAEKWAALATLLHGDEMDVFDGNRSISSNLHFPRDRPCEPIITEDATAYAINCMRVFERWAEKVHQLIEAGQNKAAITLADAVSTLNRYHPILNKKQFAESCGLTREQIYKYLPKTTNNEVTSEK